MIPESSLSLLERARAGDPEALEALIARFLPRLRRWARGRLPAWARDLCSTDDIVQETLLSTFRSLDDFEPRHDAALLAYLRQALQSRLMNEIRRARRRGQTVAIDGVETEPATHDSPLADLISQEQRKAYERALTQLSAEDREAIVGRLEMRTSYRDLAIAWGKPSADAARKTVERAVLRLAVQMQIDDPRRIS